MAKENYRSINIKNKRASFEFSLLDKYVAGMVLQGTEIKSIRLGKVTISDAFCYFKNGELFIKNMSIAIYEFGTHYNHNPLRDRKLLLNRRELKKLESKLNDKSLTIVPLRLFIDEKGLAKIEISLAKGKKLYDKRQSLKEKDAKKNELKQF